jgi:N-acetyl-anhydromuramyl-L-alanine amidase AmpD
MALVRDDMFVGISVDDVFTIKNHLVYRNGKQIPFIPHSKRKDSKGNLIRDSFPVKYFTYHYSAGQLNLNSLVTFMVNASTKADVQLCMGPKGELVQLAPLNEKCWHMGDSSYKGHHGLNQYACGIEVVNPGQLDIISPGNYTSLFGKKFTKADGIVEARHHLHGGSVKGWYPYHPDQITVLKHLALTINRHYDAELIGHDETTTRKLDPGPISKIDEIRAYIRQQNIPVVAPPPPPPEPIPPPAPVEDKKKSPKLLLQR